MWALVIFLFGCIPLFGLWMNIREGTGDASPLYGTLVLWSIAAWLHFSPASNDRWTISSTAPHAPSGTCVCECPAGCQLQQPSSGN